MYIDQNLQKALSDRIYDKRKPAALQLEQIVRKAVGQGDMEMVEGIITELSRDFAYALRHPNYRNGGLIGLAAVAIALGQEGLPAYLDDIIQPILACFGDADARVRYYACESLYNVAKIAKGDILTYFNEIFDALCKLTADIEESVRNGANLVDQLLRDIVVETATTYLFEVNRDPPQVPSAVEQPEGPEGPTLQKKLSMEQPQQRQLAFSLDRFIPLLVERIYVMNPATRMFLVQWIMLLDSIPDLELIKFVPEFLEGLLLFLTDSHKDVRVFTRSCLDNLLKEITEISELKRKSGELTDSAGDNDEGEEGHKNAAANAANNAANAANATTANATTNATAVTTTPATPAAATNGASESADQSRRNSTSAHKSGVNAGLYEIGSDTYIYYSRIIEILLSKMDPSYDETQLVVLDWIEGLLAVSPSEVLAKLSSLVATLLPALSDERPEMRKAGKRLSDRLLSMLANHYAVIDTSAAIYTLGRQLDNEDKVTRLAAIKWLQALYSASGSGFTAAANEKKRAHLPLQDDLLVKLLSPLSDPSDEVVAQDLDLLTLILRDANDEEFEYFVNKIVELFKENRALFAHRGKFVTLQLCVQLSPERVFRAIAKIVGGGPEHKESKNKSESESESKNKSESKSKSKNKSKSEEPRQGPRNESLSSNSSNIAGVLTSFEGPASRSADESSFDCLLIQNLNNILLTAPELHAFRNQLTQLHTPDGVDLFTTLFLSWKKNSVATLALCLLAQAYGHAFDVLEIIASSDVTVSTLIRIDKLVQLIEGPVFAPLRMHLLQPQRYHSLYKTLYGLLMVLPQSKAFTVLQTRLSSVSGFAQLSIRNDSDSLSTRSSSASSSNSASSVRVDWQMLLQEFKNLYESS